MNQGLKQMQAANRLSIQPKAKESDDFQCPNLSTTVEWRQDTTLFLSKEKQINEQDFYAFHPLSKVSPFPSLVTTTNLYFFCSDFKNNELEK